MVHLQHPQKWTIASTIRFAASSVVVGAFLLLVEENGRKLIEEKHWDRFFTQGADLMPDLSPFINTWWFWLLFGFSLGLAGALWVAKLFPETMSFGNDSSGAAVPSAPVPSATIPAPGRRPYQSAAARAKAEETEKQMRRYSTRLVVAAFAIIVAVGSDIYLRSSEFSFSDEVLAWGFNQNIGSYVVVNTKKLLGFKNAYKIMEINRIGYPNIDRMTDKAIGKSAAYTIDGNNIVISNPSTDKLRIAPGGGGLEHNIVLIPASLSPDNITSLIDIERVGGRLLAVRTSGLQLVPNT